MILVIEDNDGVRETLADILRQRGHQVRTSPGGKDAIEQLYQGARPSLILLDLMMPGVDGWEFRRVQLQDPDVADIPVIALTADPRVEREPELFTAYLRKPFTLDDLIALMTTHLPDPHGRRAA